MEERPFVGPRLVVEDGSPMFCSQWYQSRLSRSAFGLRMDTRRRLLRVRSGWRFYHKVSRLYARPLVSGSRGFDCNRGGYGDVSHFYAVIENDLRRVLCYSKINQIGFMVVGIGIGTDLAIDGAIAHAFTPVIYKGLLFMSMGAVLLGQAKSRFSSGGTLQNNALDYWFALWGQRQSPLFRCLAAS